MRMGNRLKRRIHPVFLTNNCDARFTQLLQIAHESPCSAFVKNHSQFLPCRYFQAQAPPMDESDLRCDLCLIGSLFSDPCSSSLCEESLTPRSPNNATIESLSCTFINIHILAVAEALSDTCFNLIIVFLSLICYCLLGRGGERGQLGEGGERGWLLLWWESVSVCTIQQPGSNELKSCSVARNVRVSSFKL